jgi:hypothetical protein
MIVSGLNGSEIMSLGGGISTFASERCLI